MTPVTAQTTAPRRRRTPEEAEREILDAAESLLRERPSRDVTVSAIMAGTTLSRKSFYVYFRDRHELIARLVGPLRSELDTAMAEWNPEAQGARATGRGALVAVARVYQRHGCLLRALAEASREDPEAARAWHEFVEPPIAQLVAAVEAGIRAGRIEPLDVEPTVRALVRMNLQTFFELLADDPDADPEEVVKPLHEVWTRTLFGGAAD